jgi:Na+/H+ antiporter NhaD/arsenite permease-like protein
MALTIHHWVSIAVFLAAYAGITLEHKNHIDKSYWALGAGLFVWVYGVATQIIPHPEEELLHHGWDVFTIVLFVWFAMYLIEILVHAGAFSIVKWGLTRLPVGDRVLVALIGVVTFFLSSQLDNLTTALIMSRLVMEIFTSRRNRIMAVGLVIITANAGGVWWFTGDLTTVMLAGAKKFTVEELLRYGFLPSIVGATVAGFMLIRKMEHNGGHKIIKSHIHLQRGALIIIPTAMAGFLLSLVMHNMHLPLFFGPMAGIVACGAIMSRLHIKPEAEDSHTDHILIQLMKRVEPSPLFFFTGILLAVGGLTSMGILQAASEFALGADPTVIRIFVVLVVIGVASAIFDNIPLVAAAMNIIRSVNPFHWVFLAYTAGTGGSMLGPGSAAGVVAMSVNKDIDFRTYVREISPAAAACFLTGVVWMMVDYAISFGF